MENLVPDLSFILMSGIFLLVVLVIHFLIFKPILALLAMRKNLTVERVAAAEAMHGETEKLFADYVQKINEAKLKGVLVKEELKREANRLAMEKFQQVRGKIDEQLQDQRKIIQTETEHARVELHRLAKDLSKSIAQKFLEKTFHFWPVTLLFWLASSSVMASAGHTTEGVPVTLWYALGNFTLLLVVLFFLLKKPVKDFFRERATQLKDKLQDAAQKRDAALGKYQSVETKLKRIEDEIKNLVETIRQEGELEKAKILNDAQMQSERMLAESHKLIQQEVRKAKEVLKEEGIQIAIELASTHIRQNIQPEDQNRIVQEYLGKMEKLP